MKPLEVFHIDDSRPPVVVLQYPGIGTGDFVLAAPLYSVGKAKPIDIITPEVNLSGRTYLLGTHLMAAISTLHLTQSLGDVLKDEYQIQRALQRLFFGN